MATILESYVIESPESNTSFNINLVEGLDESYIQYIDDEWAPIIKRQYDLALLHYFTQPEALQTDDNFNEILGKFGVPDSHWIWREKCDLAQKSDCKIYGLLNGSHLEAAMILRFDMHTHDSDSPLPLIYVDYVAVAPWNREKIQSPQRFRNLGTTMLGVAVETSRINGMEGRCGLHSLPTVEGYYIRHGMEDFDKDPDYYDLNYFEFNSASAMSFLKARTL